jgi:quercetin dioxygenase-like cupin family protein
MQYGCGRCFIIRCFHDSRYDGTKGPKPMNHPEYLVKQLTDELAIPALGKQSVVLNDNSKTKVILFSFAAGGGLAEHVAPFDATIQIISGTASLTVGDESVDGKPGTWIQMVAKTPHSIKAETPVVLLLTLVK